MPALGGRYTAFERAVTVVVPPTPCRPPALRLLLGRSRPEAGALRITGRGVRISLPRRRGGAMRGVAWRIILAVGILTAMSAVGALSEARSAATAETVKPTCSAMLTAGPPQQVTITVQDVGSGLASLVVLKSTNADTVVPPFSPGTTAPVLVTATKIDQTQTAVIRLITTDEDGNTQYCHVRFSPLVQSSEPTLPSCTYEETAGPPARVTTTIQDLESGLAEILVTKSQNADTVVPPFTVGTTDPVVTTSTKIDQTQRARVEVRATDLAGNVALCDPILAFVARTEGKPEETTFTDVPHVEHVVTLMNGSPGFKSFELVVNGKKFKFNELASGAQQSIDIGSAMRPGDNTVTLRGTGKKGSTANLLLWDGVTD